MACDRRTSWRTVPNCCDPRAPRKTTATRSCCASVAWTALLRSSVVLEDNRHIPVTVATVRLTALRSPVAPKDDCHQAFGSQVVRPRGVAEEPFNAPVVAILGRPGGASATVRYTTVSNFLGMLRSSVAPGATATPG